MTTKTITKNQTQIERPYDCIYDPTYISSREIKVTNPETYHKENLYRPSNDQIFDSTTRNASLVKAKSSMIAVKRDKIQRPDEVVVEGANRFRYGYQHGGSEILQSLPQNVIAATSVEDAVALYTARMGNSGNARTMDFCMQTDYRDEEAQTDPYSPPFVVTSEVHPEILTLATLSYGRGLPAGLAEVEMIERARAKRRWEASLPPLSDPTQLERRKKMMEQQEREEFAFREKEIEKLQQMRFNVMLKMIKEKEEQNKENNESTLKKIWTKMSEEKQTKDDKSKRSYEREIRKMASRTCKIEGKYERRDVVQDYTDFGSQVFAPLTRVGQFFDKPSKNSNISNYLESYEGLLELEGFFATSGKSATKYDIPSQRKLKSPGGYVKRKDKRQNQLDEIYREIQNKKNEKEITEKPLKYLKKVEKPRPRSTTPTLDFLGKNEDEDAAVIQLQSVLRGRSSQKRLLEDAELRKDLIDEVRSTHAVSAAGKQQLLQQEMYAQQLQENRELFKKTEAVVDSVLDEVEGACLSNVLDFLSKELVRLEDEQKVRAFSMLAERQRAMREAEEAGVRQMEIARRQENDELFKQIVNVHQATIETYLEDIILSSAQKVADLEAREAIHRKAQQIDEIATELESRRTEEVSKEIVGQLVNGFLLPHVQKELQKKKVADEQALLLQVAHEVIYDELSSS